jgi:hypothetical protein
MAQAHGPRADRGEGPVGAFFRGLGVLITAGVAMAILAAVVLLPAWQRRELARVQRDDLARQVRVQRELVQYKQGLMEAVKRDPRQTAQLLIQQQHYHLADEASIPLDAPADPPLAQMLAARAPQTPAPAALVMNLAQRAGDPATRRGMLLVAGVLMVAAMLLFQPPQTKER